MTTPAASQGKKEIADLLRALNHRITKQIEGYEEVEKRLDEIEKRIELYTRIAHAREINSRQLGFTAQIHPVPLPDGNDLPEGQFPATRGDFYRLTGSREFDCTVRASQLGWYS
ncbi:hypothetical protein RSOLAG22IIIB_05526 [Rhizoctonia solani]|uniref:Uncharacterized protein n=1 Tax=Rhizoctonia solani TaxID=456999 RepID=A0A0K6G6W8_9AGAM|nr:hypothetical protein RSOLAG22IIIB_05526 [Rhizoctonia solani]